MNTNTLQLIQERINQHNNDLDWIDNNLAAEYLDYFEQKQKKSDILNELHFLGELVESLK